MSSPTSPRTPEEAAAVVRGTLQDPKAPHTVADVAAASGLSLRDAERALQWLTKEYRGHLRVTEKGELLHLFPHGFTQPWRTQDALGRAASAMGRGLVGAARFVVRAWLMIAVVAYAVTFLAVLVALAFARSEGGGNRRGGGEVAGALFRVLADALFWTFHPFSPFAVPMEARWGEAVVPRGARRGPARDETPFYERINRFVFGPATPPPDPREATRRILAEVRAGKGRIGLADVMRVTGLPREEADPLMATLLLDYDGDVAVSDEGGITYRFPSLRPTTGSALGSEGAAAPRPPPAWATPKVLPPLTQNSFETNVLITALNAFNGVMGAVAIEKALTFQNLGLLLHGVPVELLPRGDVPIVLGVVPILFSLALFALPVGRALLRPFRERRVAKENGRLSVLRTILEARRPGVRGPRIVTDAQLAAAWKEGAGSPPEPGELTRVVVSLGGDVDLDASEAATTPREAGQVRYRFADLDLEAAALDEERRAAADDEAKVGPVVFRSDD